MAWILTIDIDADQVDLTSDQLWTAGTNGIAEVPGGHGARLLAGFETEAEAAAAQTEFGGTVAPVDPTAWGAPAATVIEVGGRALTIDAGHSFGHGAHPTTQLCLAALALHVVSGQTVLDVGCGSGVLSLAAAALGAAAITAIDIDPAAIAATNSNSQANSIAIDVSTTPFAEIDGPFDIVVINMLVAELEPLVADVCRVAGGLVILSGALIEQADRWATMFPRWDAVDETTDGEWICRTYRIAG